MTRPDTSTSPQWTYESVEYSNGIYHTVFSPEGVRVCDCSDEATAKRLVDIKNDKEASNV